ncbi:hypothetical protein DF053_08695 [Burkholderia cepacia]|uniref:hypothetical protein n=1 Tax=Burkholderia cepacia TaxID=292 RepID=UPI000F5F175D|nr:hypothetical protein [Burkholderia cepacia]RQZ89913.1 hypothetical protein DF053_08695 [Burkholderia cepacia]
MKIKALPETEILVKDGHLYIRQMDALGGEDSVVYFPRELCDLLAVKIQELASDSSLWELQSTVTRSKPKRSKSRSKGDSSVDFIMDMNLKSAAEQQRNSDAMMDAMARKAAKQRK